MTAFIACLAMLAVAAPMSLTHALAATQPADGAWIEVCTAAGAKLIKAGDGSAPAVPLGKGSHARHCPFCCGHPGVLAGGSGQALPATAAAHAVPFLFDHSPRPLFAWAFAQPRAPPAVS